jgi:hypothetical protein
MAGANSSDGSMAQGKAGNETAAGDRLPLPAPTINLVDSLHTHSRSYDMIGYCGGRKCWRCSDTGVVFWDDIKFDVQMSQYNYNWMVLGFR